MIEKLKEKIREYYKDADLSLVEKAYNLAQEAHKEQKRVSGEDYINHPISVAYILADLQLDTATITAGILHDVIEDTPYSFEDIKKEFGEEVAVLVDGVTKLSKLDFVSREEQQAENLRKMLIAMAKDIRVILIKLADRLHNMRTMKHMPPNKQKAKAQETLEIFAPIAHRLGISKIKWELEDLSLRYIDPEGYYALVNKVATKRKEREEYIQYVIDTLNRKLDEMDIVTDIQGRPKHFYSIYSKMVYKNKDFGQIFDLIAVRIIVDNIKDCYGVLGIVHTLWKPIPGRFKDYIAMPKVNMYQSLHTTVIGPKGDPVEIQIRTWEMHRTSEYGIAAHWKYKAGKNSTDDFERKLTWLRQLMEMQGDLLDSREFMETLKIDLFTDEVFVFTPKGDVINLPKGSSPIDFAYTIHSAIGNQCVGAKVNGKIVPLDYKLQNGNIVEVLTSSNSNGPSRDWLNIVKSSQARNKIRQWFKKEKRDENIQKGKEILEKEVRRQGYQYSELFKTDWTENLLKKFNYNSIDDLYATVGYGGLTLNQILFPLKEEYNKAHGKSKNKDNLDIKQFKKSSKEKSATLNGVKVSGFRDMAVRFSKCCNPVPGDKIIGYITRGRGVSIHRADCTNINNFGGTERIVDVSWESDAKVNYQAEIQIKAKDQQGLISNVSNVLAETKIPVTAMNARTTKNGTAYINLTLEVKGAEELDKLLKGFNKIKGVISTHRI
jgi:GTP pyrophosphokinase